MTYVKINETLYPATINGKIVDRDWDNRESKAITLEMDYNTVSNLFVGGIKWSIVEQNEVFNIVTDDEGNFVYNENGEVSQTMSIQEIEWDNSDFSLSGDITDHRDGTITIKMGKLTELEEAYEIMLGGF